MKEIKFLVLDVDGTMTDGGIYILEDGSQFKKFNAKDGMGIKLAIQAGVEVGIISHSHTTDMVLSRANVLGMKYVYVGQESKTTILKKWMSEMNIMASQVAFIGDDVNDLEIMSQVGFSACPSDAVKQIKSIASVTLEARGGEGAVREFIDRFVLA